MKRKPIQVYLDESERNKLDYISNIDDISSSKAIRQSININFDLITYKNSLDANFNKIK